MLGLASEILACVTALRLEAQGVRVPIHIVQEPSSARTIWVSRHHVPREFPKKSQGKILRIEYYRLSSWLHLFASAASSAP